MPIKQSVYKKIIYIYRLCKYSTFFTFNYDCVELKEEKGGGGGDRKKKMYEGYEQFQIYILHILYAYAINLL